VSSKLTYNGITLPFCDTQTFQQSAVREDSDTDWYMTRFDIVVNCVVSADFLALVAPDLLNNETPRTTNAAEIMGVVRSRLLQHRKGLSFTFNGVELLPKKADVQGTVDASNGPKPNFCNVIQMNTACFLVQFSITAHYWEFNEITPGGATIRTNKHGGEVLYHRWSEKVSIDPSNYTRRAREGRIVIRSDNVSSAQADAIRLKMCVLGVPRGWVRDSSDYTVTPDGLGLSYSVVDREVFRPPPWPAYEADGEYSESSTVMGAVRYGQVRCRLRGYKWRPDMGGLVGQDDTPQTQLLRTAVAICTGKLRHGSRFGRGILEYAVVSIGLFDSWVEASMRAKFIAEKGAVDTVVNPLITRMSDLSFPYDPAPEYPVYGGDGILLQAAGYYDPNLRNVTVDENTRQFRRGQKIPGTAGGGE
jgi:hypothetical protein